MARVGEPLRDGFSDHRPDPLGCGDLLRRRSGNPVDGSELPGECLRGRRPDVPDRQRDEHAPQRSMPCRLDAFEHLADLLVGEALELGQLRFGEVEQITDVVYEIALDEIDRRLFAEPFDVERAATADVFEGALELRRTRRRVGAMDVDLALFTDEFGLAYRALLRHHELALTAVAQLDDRPDDFRDDVARLAHDNGVADQY